MSCSLCRLPFTPGPTSVAPVPPPEGIMNDKQYNYFMKGVAMGERVTPCSMVRTIFLDNGLFSVEGTPVNGILMWESNGGTFVIMHTVCASILRHLSSCDTPDVKSVTDLCELELVLGRPQDGPKAGRFRYVRYDEVGEDKVDIERYKFLGEDGRNMRLDWQRLKNDGYEWTWARPDTFPRFHATVAQSRFPGPSAETRDILTTQSLVILHTLLPYLDDKAFVMLLSTCRTFRRHALTTFQSHARARILDLGWAMPLPKEYAAAAAATREKGLLAHAEHSPMDGDWNLYLSAVHKSQSMRARRRIWALAGELRRTFLDKRAGSKYEDVVTGDGDNLKTIQSTARQNLERQIARNPVSMFGINPWW